MQKKRFLILVQSGKERKLNKKTIFRAPFNSITEIVRLQILKIIFVKEVK